MGTYLTGEVAVIHNATTADFENYAYSAIFCNVAGTYTINGASVILVAGETLEVVIDGDNTTLSSNNFLLLGNPIAVQTKVKTGLITATGGTKQYQFVNIKTGLPTNG
jgi:hypothetical protein